MYFFVILYIICNRQGELRSSLSIRLEENSVKANEVKPMKLMKQLKLFGFLSATRSAFARFWNMTCEDFELWHPRRIIRHLTVQGPVQGFCVLSDLTGWPPRLETCDIVWHLRICGRLRILMIIWFYKFIIWWYVYNIVLYNMISYVMCYNTITGHVNITW